MTESTNLAGKKYNVNATDLPASFGGYDLLYRGAPEAVWRQAQVELQWNAQLSGLLIEGKEATADAA